MKKIALGLVFAALLLVIPAAAFAQTPNWEGNFHKGDLTVAGGFGFGYGFTIVPAVEYTIVDFKIGDTVPLAIGVTGKGVINFYPDFFTSYGVGALVTAHMGFRGLDIPDFLQRFDVYASVGVGFSFFSYVAGATETYGASRFGFATSDGVAWFINDNLAVFVEGNYWAYSGGGTIGILYKF
jgi:opacity protein-like surface antigen